MKKCPFCAEEIQDGAVKCKHCGEMLAGAKPVESAPTDYRAVKKGIKRAELDEGVMQIQMALVIILSLVIGFILQSWKIGLGIFVVFTIFVARSYYELGKKK